MSALDLMFKGPSKAQVEKRTETRLPLPITISQNLPRSPALTPLVMPSTQPKQAPAPAARDAEVNTTHKIVKLSVAGQVPSTPEAVHELLSRPARLFEVFHTEKKDADAHVRRDRFLLENYGLHPRHTDELALIRYIAFMGARPSTFETYASHIRNLYGAGLDLDDYLNTSRYYLRRFALGAPFCNQGQGGMDAAVKFFRSCLGKDGHAAMIHKFREGLAYLNPAGDPRVRGSISREQVLAFSKDPLLKDRHYNTYSQGLIWQAAFGFRTGQMSTLKVSDFKYVEVQAKGASKAQKTLRYVGAKHKEKLYKDGGSSEIHTALPIWLEDLKDLYESKKAEQAKESRKGEVFLFPRWKPATINQHIKTLCRRAGLGEGLTWVNHGVREGAARLAAQTMLDSAGSIEQIVMAIKEVTGHESDEMALYYALGNDVRADKSVARENALAKRRAIMDTGSPFYQPNDSYEHEGRILKRHRDEANPKAAPPIVSRKMIKESKEEVTKLKKSQLKKNQEYYAKQKKLKKARMLKKLGSKRK